MKTPAELAAILRERLIHSRPHYDIKGQPLRTIVVTQEWLEDMADAANVLSQEPKAWLITSKTGLVRSALTRRPDEILLAFAASDGDIITPLIPAPQSVGSVTADPQRG
jgi:hypothetical protein